MPVCEVLFEISDPVAARLAIIKALEANKYKIQENTLPRIVAQHQLSLTRHWHKVEVEFDPPTNQCIPVTVTLRIDHSDCQDYMKAVVAKLGEVLPNLKITSVKPKMSLNLKTKADFAESATVKCKEIEPELKSWRCKHCGSENDLDADLCKTCGTVRHALVDPEG